MSKIGQYNLELTEKVNELGYDTVEEAIADGWDSNEFYASYHEEVRDAEQDKAHEAWLREKAEVIGDLNNMLAGLAAAGKSDTTEFGIIQHAIKFINEGEM